MSTQIGLGVHLHHYFASKFLIDSLSHNVDRNSRYTSNYGEQVINTSSN